MFAKNFRQIVGPLIGLAGLRYLTFEVVADAESAGYRNEGNTFARRPETRGDADAALAHVGGNHARRIGSTIEAKRRGGSGAGVDHVVGAQGVEELALCFTEVGKAEFVDAGWIDRPHVRSIDLLRAGVRGGSKARGNVGRERIKMWERANVRATLKIVIDVQVLVWGKLMIETEQELSVLRICKPDGP